MTQQVSFRGADLCARYMEQLKNKNPELVEVATDFHRSGKIPTNTFLLDLDAHVYNAETMRREADKYNLSLYYMSKQVARNPIISQGVLDTGFKGIVAVEIQDVRILNKYGVKISHIGHLVNIPTSDVEFALSMRPEVVTVFNLGRAKQVATVASKRGFVQKLLVRPIGAKDLVLPYMEGGFSEDEIVPVVKEINRVKGVKVIGLTTFPAILFDLVKYEPFLTPNVDTVKRTKAKLEENGVKISQMNLPSNNHTTTMKMIAGAGATHVEPGQGVTGFSQSQIYGNSPEIPAFVYVTEVSHFVRNWTYIFGGGFAYIDVWGITYEGGITNPDKSKFQFPVFVGKSSSDIMSNMVNGEMFQGLVDYHARLYNGPGKAEVGDTVICGWRPQMFLTRAMVAVVGGIKDHNPKLLGIFDHAGNPVDRHGRLRSVKAVKRLIGTDKRHRTQGGRETRL
jgi:predicted amino acid racemase